MLRRSPWLIWCPLPWFLGMWGIYYGIGPLAYPFASPESVSYMDGFYRIDEGGLWRTNLLNLVGLASAMAGTVVASSVVRPRSRPAPQGAPAPAEAGRLALLFGAVGVLLNFLVVLPHSLGLSERTLPGSVQYLGEFAAVALMLAIAAAQVGSARWWAIAGALSLVGGFTALMTLSKLAMIKFGLVLALGFCVWRPRPRLVIGVALILVVAYAMVLTPLVAVGRAFVNPRGLQDVTSTGAFLGWFAREGHDEAAKMQFGVQAWWTRLSYANAQAFAMDAYDRGQAGDSVWLAAWAIVPRWLYPDKPILTVGGYFNYLVTGTDMSQAAPGVVAEGYWNAGWPGAVGTAFWAGLFLGAFTSLSLSWMRASKLAYLPVVWLGIASGLQPDSWFAGTYVGSAAIAILLCGGLRWLARETRKSGALSGEATGIHHAYPASGRRQWAVPGRR
jgi:hypothetical protein